MLEVCADLRAAHFNLHGHIQADRAVRAHRRLGDRLALIRRAGTLLRREGVRVEGPFPADTLFHAAARRRYDAVLCMYHDQALIPLKTIDFTGGVNVTLGLPFIRTSPDHGTALDIAGSGKADPTSLVAALKLAGEMAQRRSAQRARA